MSATQDPATMAEEPIHDKRYVEGYQRPSHEPFECGACDGPLIMDEEQNKRCFDCGLIPGDTRSTSGEGETWSEWQDHRRDNDNYDGWYGADRIKFVGGFFSAYLTEDGDIVI